MNASSTYFVRPNGSRLNRTYVSSSHKNSSMPRRAQSNIFNATVVPPGPYALYTFPVRPSPISFTISTALSKRQYYKCITERTLTSIFRSCFHNRVFRGQRSRSVRPSSRADFLLHSVTATSIRRDQPLRPTKPLLLSSTLLLLLTRPGSRIHQKRTV